jgi:hypothetical protein
VRRNDSQIRRSLKRRFIPSGLDCPVGTAWSRAGSKTTSLVVVAAEFHFARQILWPPRRKLLGREDISCPEPLEHDIEFRSESDPASNELALLSRHLQERFL